MSFMKNIFGKGVGKTKEGWLTVLHKYQDGVEERNWVILSLLDDKTAYKEFPDFDVAYIRAAITESRGIPGDWDNAILKQGLRKSNRKSNLLFCLSANHLFQQIGDDAFIESVQAFYACDKVPFGPGNHVYAYYYLWSVYSQLGGSRERLLTVPDLIAMNNPGIAIRSGDFSMIEQVASRTARKLDRYLIVAAEKIIQSKFPVCKQEGAFPEIY